MNIDDWKSIIYSAKTEAGEIKPGKDGKQYVTPTPQKPGETPTPVPAEQSNDVVLKLIGLCKKMLKKVGSVTNVSAGEGGFVVVGDNNNTENKPKNDSHNIGGDNVEGDKNDGGMQLTQRQDNSNKEKNNTIVGSSVDGSSTNVRGDDNKLKKGTQDSLTKTAVSQTKVAQGGVAAKNDSVQIFYSIDNSILEGNCSSVSVTRRCDKYMPKWYVLSESSYGEDNRYTSLDSYAVRRKLNTRSDVMNYVKSSDNAMIMKFESVNHYNINDVFGRIPSALTPLYESVVFVKFDDDDNVEQKIYLGNNIVKC